MTPREPRSRIPPRALIAGLVALLSAAALPGAAQAERAAQPLYQWTDEGGNVRYTPDPDRVPSGRRSTLVLVVPGMPQTSAAQRPAAAVSAPPVAATPAAPAAAPIAAAPVAPPIAAPPAAATIATPPPRAAPPPPVTEIAASAPAAGEREQELLLAIAADEAALEALISAPPTPGEPPLAQSAPLREIALRLPQLQAELRALREQPAPAARP